MLELEIGTHLVKSDAGYDVNLPPEKTKTKSTVEFPLPAMLVPFIQRYLSYYRGVLAAGPNGSLVEPAGSARFMWLARSGAQFPVASFEDMVGRRTTARLKQRLRPHDFRHCVATSIAQFDPEQFHIIRIVLGHATMATADKHYIRAKGIEFARLVQASREDHAQGIVPGSQGVGINQMTVTPTQRPTGVRKLILDRAGVGPDSRPSQPQCRQKSRLFPPVHP